jgi:hypothetical protein
LFSIGSRTPETARSNAEEMLRIAEEADDASLLIAHYSLGGVLWHIATTRLLSAISFRRTHDITKTRAARVGIWAGLGVWTLSYLEHAQLSLVSREGSTIEH